MLSTFAYHLLCILRYAASFVVVRGFTLTQVPADDIRTTAVIALCVDVEDLTEHVDLYTHAATHVAVMPLVVIRLLGPQSVLSWSGRVHSSQEPAGGMGRALLHAILPDRHAVLARMKTRLAF